MENDCFKYVEKCHLCKIYVDKINKLPAPITEPWPFSMWGIEAIGIIHPKASNGHRLILVTIGYFTKWVEAVLFTKLTKPQGPRFIKQNIICRYGVPQSIITGNGQNLNNDMIDALYAQFEVHHHSLTPYRPKIDGTVEATNKNIRKIL